MACETAFLAAVACVLRAIPLSVVAVQTEGPSLARVAVTVVVDEVGVLVEVPLSVTTFQPCRKAVLNVVLLVVITPLVASVQLSVPLIVLGLSKYTQSLPLALAPLAVLVTWVLVRTVLPTDRVLTP
jgi:hypothetical protein